MLGPCILIASDLNLHREVLQGVLLALHPHLPVLAVAPIDLDSLPQEHDPRLIICNDEAIIRQLHPPAWILVFPNEQDLALVGIGVDRRSLPNVSLAELVTVIDELWSLQALTPPSTPLPTITQMSDPECTHLRVSPRHPKSQTGINSSDTPGTRHIPEVE